MISVGLVISLCLLSGHSTASRPHILFIVADDLGWNDVSWHNPQMITPNLEKLAKNGVILNSSYVQPVCSPSRNCFMSGYYPFHTGLQHAVIHNWQANYLPGNLTTLPQKMKDLGYSTHMIGKWHLGFCDWKYTPTFRGFDSFLGFYSGAEDYYTHMQGILGYGHTHTTDRTRQPETATPLHHIDRLDTTREFTLITEHIYPINFIYILQHAIPRINS
ncbi:hypothetical protein ScPMuIL_014384 [Solemya velum]